MFFAVLFCPFDASTGSLSHGIVVAVPAVCDRCLDHPGADQYSGAEPQFEVGLGATLPIIFGACIAAALIVFVVGFGVGETLLRFPRVQQAMAWAGVLWLTWLAWQIFQSAPPSLNPTTPRDEGLSVFGAATLQLLNPKVWMMAVAVASVFVGGGDKTTRLVVLSLVFLLVSLPCMTLWALLGVASARLFGSPQAFKRANYALAFCCWCRPG